jgi:hypothetical protein
MQDYSQILNARGWASSPVPQTPVEPKDADYHARVEGVLDAICRPDYSPGMILWLGRADPGLYERLTFSLPDRISCLWNAHAPLNEFQSVVDEWLAAHRRACSLFKMQGIESREI